MLVNIDSVDKIERPIGVHAFFRTFISKPPKAAQKPSSYRLDLHRHDAATVGRGNRNALPYRDAKQRPNHPSSSPCFSGQNGVFVSKAVQTDNFGSTKESSEIVDREAACFVLDHVVQTCPKVDLVPGVGVEPTRYRYR
jgi:hypothetical protein